MPSEDYASHSGAGALKLKGSKAGVKPKKKKQQRDKPSNLERALSTGGGEAPPEGKGKEVEKSRRRAKDGDKTGEDDEPPSEKGEGDDEVVDYKTEAEKRYEEVQRKKMMELTKSSSARPELLKTHKERVEELNTYLSKLSEHHDMPKIGPG